MAKLIDLSVAVNSNTLSPPSTNIRLEITPHRRGPGFWQVFHLRGCTGIVIMEGITNLGAFPRRQVPFYAPLYKIQGTARGAAARFFAKID
jgi:kynurenine formamidase